MEGGKGKEEGREETTKQAALRRTAFCAAGHGQWAGSGQRAEGEG